MKTNKGKCRIFKGAFPLIGRPYAISFLFIQATDFQLVILDCSHVVVYARSNSRIFSLIITNVAEMFSFIRLPSASNLTVLFSASVQFFSAISQNGLAVQNARF